VPRRDERAVEDRQAVGELTGTIIIPTRAAAHEYVAATLSRAQLADSLPDHGWPLRATRVNCVFVADKADR